MKKLMFSALFLAFGVVAVSAQSTEKKAENAVKAETSALQTENASTAQNKAAANDAKIIEEEKAKKQVEQAKKEAVKPAEAKSTEKVDK